MEYNSDSPTSLKITGDWLNRSEEIQDGRFIVGNVKMVNQTKTIYKSPLS